MCLRDGMHAKRHNISVNQMKQVATALDLAGVPLIEVTHGDGLGGASVNYGFPAHTDEEYLSAVVPVLKSAKVFCAFAAGYWHGGSFENGSRAWCHHDSRGDSLH